MQPIKADPTSLGKREPEKRVLGRHPKHNKGVALIMALMVFALVSAIAATIMTQLSRERNLLNQMQNTATLKQQLIGGESWARHAFAQMTNSTLPAETEAPLILTTHNFTLANEGDSMRVVIIDRQNCYNLNRLANDEINELALQEVERLLASLDIDIAEQLKDWVDYDQDITGDTGHEDEFYQAQSPSFRTADSALVSATELRLLQREEDNIETLLPYVCFLPDDIGMNINRVSSSILNAVLPDLTNSEESSLFAQIATAGFESVDEFMEHESVAEIEIDESNWRVNVAFVDVFVDVTLAGRSMSLHSKLHKADDGVVSSYYRAYGVNQHLQRLFGIPPKQVVE